MFISLTFKLILNHASRVSVEHIQIDDPKHKSTIEIYFHPRKNLKRRANPPLTQGKYFDSKRTQYYRTERRTQGSGAWLCTGLSLLKV